MGVLTVVLKNVISPHSEDSVIVYVPEEKVVFIGDAYDMDYYNNCEYGPVKLEGLINVLKNFDFNICFPGHSSPINKTDIVKYLKAQHKKYVK